MEFLIFLICLIILIFFIYWGIYNYLVEVKNNVSTAYANIDVQLKKRYDLIPNLVNSVREYMKYEKETLEKLISLRTKAVSNKTQSGERLALVTISHLSPFFLDLYIATLVIMFA